MSNNSSYFCSCNWLVAERLHIQQKERIMKRLFTYLLRLSNDYSFVLRIYLLLSKSSSAFFKLPLLNSVYPRYFSSFACANQSSPKICKCFSIEARKCKKSSFMWNTSELFLYLLLCLWTYFTGSLLSNSNDLSALLYASSRSPHSSWTLANFPNIL